jgi:hypothetical protein
MLTGRDASAAPRLSMSGPQRRADNDRPIAAITAAPPNGRVFAAPTAVAALAAVPDRSRMCCGRQQAS